MRLRRINPICTPSLAPGFLNPATGGLARLRRENDPSDRLNPSMLLRINSPGVGTCLDLSMAEGHPTSPVAMPGTHD
jgi:hypothetical protein